MLKIDGMDINYKVIGDGDLVVLLHGWGQNIEMMQPLVRALKNKKVLIIDLPGFGNSGEPNFVWSIEDYADFVNKIVNNLGYNKCSIIGHSFGGKIGLFYASKYDVDKLILLASPYKVEIKKESLKLKVFKKVKKVPILKKTVEFAKKHMGSTDYRNASGIMRDILVKHVNNDITENVKKIKCPVLIIWGDNDVTVDKSNAYELESLIKDAGVVILPGTHYAYLENINQVIRIIKNFMGE